jgi:hypothetical protein
VSAAAGFRQDEGRAVRVTAVALLVLAAIHFAYPLIRAFFDFEIDYNEGWNGYFQLRAPR